MFVAHIHPNTLKEQSVKEHLYNVSKMAREYSAKISLSSTGELIGALHDMGKQTDVFNAYIHYSSIHPHDKSRKGAIDHSTAGAKFIYDNFYGTKDLYQRCVAQMISLAVYSHHRGLGDCLDLEGNDLFARRINKDKEIFYDEAVAKFIEECYSIKEIEALFNKSKQEIKNIIGKINEIDTCVRFRKFAFGMTERYVFSCLIDADRYDTYKFMEQKNRKKCYVGHCRGKIFVRYWRINLWIIQSLVK
jgi:CRISPR-associated endonuclease/helicase Cas3